MSDRQTDKSTHWQTTMYGDNISVVMMMMQSKNMPEYIHTIYGGVEKCPETGREHFQGHIKCKRQVRLSQLKKTFPGAHFEIPRNYQASINYALKTETAIGYKGQIENQLKYETIGAICKSIAEEILIIFKVENESQYEDMLASLAEFPKNIQLYYWVAVGGLLRKDPALRENPGQYARTDVKAIWNGCYRVYLDDAIALVLRQSQDNEEAINTLHYPQTPPSPPLTPPSPHRPPRQNSDNSMQSVREIIESIIIKQDGEVQPL